MRATQVKEFHTTYECPIHEGIITSNIAHMEDERVGLRLNLILEEVKELLKDGFGVDTTITFKQADDTADITKALENTNRRDIVEIADALGDLSYVIDGFALEAGIPLDDVLSEIHRSNMSKLGEDGKPIYREDGKVLKGPNFSEPDIHSVIFRK